MKTILPFLLLLLVSCSSENNAGPMLASGIEPAPDVPPGKKLFIPIATYGPEGFYTGPLQNLDYDPSVDAPDKRITLCIDSFDATQVYGHTILPAMERPFSGSYSKTGEDYSVIASERGNDGNDGKLVFTIHASKKKISGTWIAPNEKSPVRARTFALNYRKYVYKPGFGLPEMLVGMSLAGSGEPGLKISAKAVHINASAGLLASGILENLSPFDLEMIRNAIYARHGYAFEDKKILRLFNDHVPWYLPVTTDISGQLTSVEMKNIALIRRFERSTENHHQTAKSQ